MDLFNLNSSTFRTRSHAPLLHTPSIAKSLAVVFLGIVSPMLVLAQETISTISSVPISSQPTISPASYTIVSPVPPTSPEVWGARIVDAMNTLSPERLPRIDVAREKLIAALQQLDTFLSSAPNYRDQWRSFVQWDAIQRELNAPSPDLENVVQLERNFRQNYQGLEMPYFSNVRDALTGYAHAIRFGTDQTKSTEILKNRLTKLSELLLQESRDSDPNAIRDIALTVSYLAQSNQALSLVEDVRANYGRPNARVLLSADFVRQRFARPVNQSNPVDEVILGTKILGQSQLDGCVSPQLIDSPFQAKLRLMMNSSFASNNIGYNRGVKLHTTGAANILAGETLTLTDHGFALDNDTFASAAMTSQINAIEAKLRIIQRIASRQAAKQKPLADSIAQGRLESRVRNQFHEQLSEQLVEANTRIQPPDPPAMARLGLKRPSRNTWSSTQYMAMLWKLQERSQLGAPTSCPLVVEPTGVTVQVHQSAIANAIDPILSGRIIRSTELDGFAKQFGDAMAIKVQPKKEDGPWSISMASFHPVEAQFDDSLITLRIRTTKLDRGDQSLDQAASIEASYRVDVRDGALQLERVGEVRIDFTGKQQRGVRAVTLRSFLKNKFDEVFRPQLLDTPLRVTDKLPGDMQGLRLVGVQIDEGWLQAHVR